MEIDQSKNEIFKLLKSSNASNLVIDQMLTKFAKEFNVSYEMLYNDYYNRELAKPNPYPNINNRLPDNKPTRKIKVAPRNRYDIAEFGLLKSALYDKQSFLGINKFMEGRYIHLEAYQIRLALEKYYQIHYIFEYEEFVKELSPKLREFFDDRIYNQEFGTTAKYIEQLKKTFALKFLIEQRQKFEELKRSDLISDDEKARINEKIIMLSKEIKSQEKK